MFKQSMLMLIKISEEEIISRVEKDKGKTLYVVFSRASTEDILSISGIIRKKSCFLIFAEGTYRDKKSL